jgi:hypothetical protein
MAPKPEPEAPPDMDEADGEADAGWSKKKLRRLFSRATASRAKSVAARGQ